MSTTAGNRPPTGLRLIQYGIGAIICLFLVAALLGLYETRRIQTSNQLIVENMLASIELVGRLVHDVEEKQSLINDHILEPEAGPMARIEKRIAEVDADFAATARAYEPIANTPGEPETWAELKSQIASLQKPIEQVLADSRLNNDTLARTEMMELDGRFDRVDQIGADLIHLNHGNAQRTEFVLAAQQRASLVILSISVFSGTVLALLVAIWVTRGIGARETQLLSIASALEEHNRDLDAFAGRVAHDLRSPLNTIGMAAAQLSRRSPHEEGTAALLTRGVARMETLIRDLLAFSQSGAGGNVTDCDPSVIAKAVEEETASRVRAAGGTLHVSVAPAAVRCCEGLLHQAFSNLVDNAVKYRRRDVPVEVDIGGGVVNAIYELCVRDNGIGMARDDAKRAFDPFFRAATSTDRPGTGLGLSIVKRVVEANGGTVAIDSQTDRGTSVIIHLPLVTQHPSRASGPRVSPSWP